MSRRILTLENKAKKYVSKEGIAIDEKLHNDLLDIMKSFRIDISSFPVGSFKRFFVRAN